MTITSTDTTHTARMDRNYRLQRHIYDLTRRYYLVGRDRLLFRLHPLPNESIIEAGCGTGRNLRILAQRHPRTRFFGFDASTAMLATAAARSKNMKITLRCALAEEFSAWTQFGLFENFDAIFFSYSLSMMPSWPQAIDNAWENLRPGGRLLIVDFWDAAILPSWCGVLLRAWLRRFHTYPRPEIVEHLRGLPYLVGPVCVSRIGPRYAFLAECRKGS